MPRQTFTRREIDAFRAHAEQAPPAQKQEGITLREAVLELTDVIIDMRERRGYSTADLVAWWHGQGVEASAATLRGYIRAAIAGSPKRSGIRERPKTRASSGTVEQPSGKSASTPSATHAGSTGLRLPKDL